MTQVDYEPEQWTEDFRDCTDMMLEKYVDDNHTPDYIYNNPSY